MLNLDTHIALFAAAGTLSTRERELLDSDFWCISDIVLWEITRLHRDGKINLNLNDPALSAMLGRITVWPISREVALATRQLDFVSDPVDELIAATSIAHDVPLVTRDMRILGSKVVPLALT
jgi:PIN domain nuclease of toxin-antitoxin system